MLSHIIFTIQNAANALSKATTGKLDEAEAAMQQSKLLSLLKSLKEDRDKPEKVYQHYAGSREFQIFSWRNADRGMLVTRSDHWYEQSGKPKPEELEIGILTDHHFFQDGKGRIYSEPSIWWEGGTMSSMTHPINIAPYRTDHGLPTMTIDDGQWGTHGPTKNTVE